MSFIYVPAPAAVVVPNFGKYGPDCALASAIGQSVPVNSNTNLLPSGQFTVLRAPTGAWCTLTNVAGGLNVVIPAGFTNVIRFEVSLVITCPSGGDAGFQNYKVQLQSGQTTTINPVSFIIPPPTGTTAATLSTVLQASFLFQGNGGITQQWQPYILVTTTGAPGNYNATSQIFAAYLIG